MTETATSVAEQQRAASTVVRLTIEHGAAGIGLDDPITRNALDEAGAGTISILEGLAMPPAETCSAACCTTSRSPHG